MNAKWSLISISLALTCFIFLFTSTTSVRAQGVPVGQGITLTASSDNPVPGQSLTITAKSYNIDIDSAKVTWSVDGKTIQSGIGLTTITMTAPSLGKTDTVSVTAVATDGEVEDNSITIGSGEVDMIIEPDGYTPPFFKGKLPVSYQNSVTIIAVPHLADASGKEYDPKTLVYHWSKNDQADESQSGYGKQSAVFSQGLIPRAFDVNLVVSTRDGNAQAQGMVTISADSPDLTFYLNDPLYGPMYNRAARNTVRIGSQKELGILAVPYGFNNVESGNSLTYSWLINGKENSNLSSGRSIVLRAPDGQSGSSNIELDISNSTQILQGAKSAFSAIFNSLTGSSSSPVTF